MILLYTHTHKKMTIKTPIYLCYVSIILLQWVFPDFKIYQREWNSKKLFYPGIQEGSTFSKIYFYIKNMYFLQGNLGIIISEIPWQRDEANLLFSIDKVYLKQERDYKWNPK